MFKNIFLAALIVGSLSAMARPRPWEFGPQKETSAAKIQESDDISALELESWITEPNNGTPEFDKVAFRDERNICTTEDGDGIRYHVKGREDRDRLKEEALDKCRRNARRPRTCAIVGCDKIRD